ncbi:MAG TPA: hypothetical protein VFB34_10370 [Chloroflexota bacterium]|nr:hypothetical protein [Chloroflexota bacterium]
MITCPFCSEPYRGYRIVGVAVADESITGWLDERLPLAMLFCYDCGRGTFMHPDHPEVQRLEPEPPLEKVETGVRTLNVDLDDVGDSRLKRQFIEGRPD